MDFYRNFKVDWEDSNPINTDTFIAVYDTLCKHDLFGSMKHAMNILDSALISHCGVKHITGRKFRQLFEDMERTLDGGLPIEIMFLESFDVFDSKDLSVFIISPFVKSGLLVIQMYDKQVSSDTDNFNALSCCGLHYSDEDDSKYLNGIALFGNDILEKSYYKKIVYHELTHYVVKYFDKVIVEGCAKPLELITNELLADILQYIVGDLGKPSTDKSDIKFGLDEFDYLSKTYISEIALEKYQPFIEAIKEYHKL